MDETHQNNSDELEKLYADLKRSIFTDKTATAEIDVITTETAIGPRKKSCSIRLCIQKREHPKVMSSQYEIRCVLYKLKTSLCNNSKELFKTLLTGIMAVSNAYKTD